MHQGYLMIFQNRAKQITTYDFSNPRSPKLISTLNEIGNGDEHSVPVSGTKVLASGMLIEYADPFHPKLLSRWNGPLLSVFPAFEWPYLYNTRTYDTDGKSSPLTVLDYSDFVAGPKQVTSIDAVSKVGFTTGTCVAIGNLLLVSSGDVYSGVSAWDIGDPKKPELISSNKNGTGMYTAQHYGKYIMTTGRFSAVIHGFYDFSNPENIQLY